MTDEQIKQNAEWYSKAVSNPDFNWRDDENIASAAYIAGAHSRDEEVEELKKKLEDMTKLKNFFASSLDIYDKDNKELQDELKMNAENLQKLRNPWISVEERLPERHTPVYAKNNNKSWFFALRTDNRQRPWYNIVGRCGEKVTHWKPIPELRKGE